MRRHVEAAAIVVVLALLAIAVVLDLSGHRLLVVSGSSMEPAIPTGSLVIVRPALPATLSVGDVVAFQLRGSTIAHRISAIEELGDARAFRTKGDASMVADPEPIAFDDRAGLLVAQIPLAGYLLGLLQAYGRILSIGVAAVIAILLLRGRWPVPFPLPART